VHKRHMMYVKCNGCLWSIRVDDKFVEMYSSRVDSCTHETDAQEIDADEVWGGCGQ